MNVAKSTIKKVLLSAGYVDSNYNVMTIEDGLQWEAREDFDTIEEAVMAVIEDSVNLTVVSV